MNIAICTLGCKVNQYETQAMERELIRRGHALADFDGPADAYIVNTCTVTAVSDKKCRGIIRRTRKNGPEAVVAVCGLVIGALCGYYGGMADALVMRLCDAVAAFPSVLLALVVLALTGPGKYNVIGALGVLFIPSFARLVRGEFLKYRDRDFVQAAKLMGVPDPRIIFVHILPNLWPTLLSGLTIGFNNAVLAEASMSYLGIGVNTAEPSLGYLLKDGQGVLFTLPWCAVFPGLAAILLILGVSLLGEGIRERMGGTAL